MYSELPLSRHLERETAQPLVDFFAYLINSAHALSRSEFSFKPWHGHGRMADRRVPSLCDEGREPDRGEPIAAQLTFTTPL